MKNVTRLTKKTPPKPHKIQRMVTVVGKKENGGQGLIKCGITFKDDQDCTKFRETFVKAVAALPEIVKAPQKPKESKEEAKKPKEEGEKKSTEKPKVDGEETKTAGKEQLYWL